ncbi:MAG TPA: SDR family oxidoreductase [Rhodospirillales bacterium]|jgi:NAD(P)-dependent dehydrogenase (short-subunit alcohol dehydrogenase family)|nr:MAG: C-factor [Alphaproteobacteria bacterium MarineAlpha3_Bin2]HIC27958.1 SDR family oxidoreductase [Rhodospirillales bacterium]HIE19715.1 SDR family oxidoreductase [Rhodospirillales bacterium]HIM24079.1 SDR family oxidoreductase [Rhodospirillales bacterium]HIM77279.1 SDR family oxidoreductase [Rhodospirillales bacterium]
MPTVFITGANRGLGFEFAKQYAADGWRVIAACRDPAKAEALSAVEGDVQVETMDVDDDASVASLSDKLKDEAIDLLINNAGIYGPKHLSAEDMDYEAWGRVLRTNTMSPFRVTMAFLQQVRNSDQKIIATLSSKMGSLNENQDGGEYIYRSSKAALNAALKGLSYDLADAGIRIMLMHPGWASTDMGGPSAPLLPADGVAGLRKVLAGIKDGETGVFYDYNGGELAW